MPYKDHEKQKQFQREWCAKRRLNFLKDKQCVKCDSLNNLELHHKNPKDKISHRIWSWRETRRLKEIEKCEILCNVCHKEETKKIYIK